LELLEVLLGWTILLSPIAGLCYLQHYLNSKQRAASAQKALRERLIRDRAMHYLNGPHHGPGYENCRLNSGDMEWATKLAKKDLGLN